MTAPTDELSQTSEAVFYLSKGEEVFGPHTAGELQSFLDQFIILPEDFVWRPGLENWVPIQEAFNTASAPTTATVPASEDGWASQASSSFLPRNWEIDPAEEVARIRPDNSSRRFSLGVVTAVVFHLVLLVSVAWASPTWWQVALETPKVAPTDPPPLEVAFVPEPPDTPPPVAPPPPQDVTPPPDIPPPPAPPEIPIDVPPPAPVQPPVQNLAPTPLPPPLIAPPPAPIAIAVHPKKKLPKHVAVQQPAVTDASPTDYLEAPPPRYPPDALRQRKSGTVVLLVAISEEGEPIGVRVVQSSGFAILDDTALRQVQDRYRFKAGSARLFRVPISFRLKN